VAIIDPEGLFGGDRLRRCSNAAQLHWPRLFLASDGFARLEINYARIIGRAYPTFNPVPSDAELQACLQEYAKNYLLFLYEVGGQLWGQWDTRAELLPRYKTAADRRSPIPPEPAFTRWKPCYREDNKPFPKCFGSISETLQYGVGVGGGKNTCASDDARVSGLLPSIDNPPFGTTKPDVVLEAEPDRQKKPNPADGFEDVQRSWFEQWWVVYWRKRDRKKAWLAFKKQVRTQTRFDQVMKATAAQAPEMFSKDEQYRPYGTTWLNGERWEDETTAVPPAAAQDDYPEFPA